jgi:hypothetical protein
MALGKIPPLRVDVPHAIVPCKILVILGADLLILLQ